MDNDQTPRVPEGEPGQAQQPTPASSPYPPPVPPAYDPFGNPRLDELVEKGQRPVVTRDIRPREYKSDE